MRLPLCYPIESRDGTLNADSKMKNMVVEAAAQPAHKPALGSIA